MIKINRWKRLGNSIIQLINILHIALYYNYKIITPKHPYFNINYINNILENENLDNNIVLQDHDNFFYRNRIKNIDKNIFNFNYEKVINILRSAFVIKDIPILDENDLVLHIRSGDIFSRNPHPKYIVPPLSYYINILDNNNFNKIIIVAEDTKNPVINELIKLYPDIIYKKQHLIEDIKIILGTSKIVQSVGTFIPYLLLFSDNIKDIYKPSYQGWCNHLIDVNIYNTDLKDYRLKLIPWNNTLKQRIFLLKYKQK